MQWVRNSDTVTLRVRTAVTLAHTPVALALTLLLLQPAGLREALLEWRRSNLSSHTLGCNAPDVQDLHETVALTATSGPFTVLSVCLHSAAPSNWSGRILTAV